jgi:hypothetical protein
MNVRQDMRASDHDRQQVVDVLRAGLEDGAVFAKLGVESRAELAVLAAGHGDRPGT